MPAPNPLHPYGCAANWPGGIRRLTINVPAEDLNMIENAVSQAGTASALCACTIKAIADELRTVHPTGGYAPETVYAFLRRLASCRSTGREHLDNVAGGKSRLRNKDKKSATGARVQSSCARRKLAEGESTQDKARSESGQTS